jgi:hypothetical protein
MACMTHSEDIRWTAVDALRGQERVDGRGVLVEPPLPLFRDGLASCAFLVDGRLDVVELPLDAEVPVLARAARDLPGRRG